MLGINADPVTIKSIEWAIIERASRKAGSAGAARDAHRQEGRGRRLGPVGPGGGRSAEQGRPHRHGVRARRSHRRPAALRHPRVQDGEGVLDRRLAPDGGRGHRLQAGLRRRRVAGRGDAARRRSTRWCSPAASRSAATCRFPGRELEGIHFAMDYLPLQNKRCEGRRHQGRASSSRRRTSTS